MSQLLPGTTTRRLALHLLAVAAVAACGGKSDTEGAAGTAGANGRSAAGADSASSNVVMKSVPPTAGDRSLAVPDSGAATDTNRSGMAVQPGGAPKDSN